MSLLDENRLKNVLKARLHFDYTYEGIENKVSSLIRLEIKKRIPKMEKMYETRLIAKMYGIDQRKIVFPAFKQKIEEKNYKDIFEHVFDGDLFFKYAIDKRHAYPDPLFKIAIYLMIANECNSLIFNNFYESIRTSRHKVFEFLEITSNPELSRGDLSNFDNFDENDEKKYKEMLEKFPDVKTEER